MIRIIFICTGNICRSPLAATILRKMLAEKGVGDVMIDSAGTFGMYRPTVPDRMMVCVAKEAGYELDGLSRRVTDSDLEKNDLIICLGESNFEELIRRYPNHRNKIRRFVEYVDDPAIKEVPDPHGEKELVFRVAFRIIERGCRRIVDEITPKS